MFVEPVFSPSYSDFTEAGNRIRFSQKKVKVRRMKDPIFQSIVSHFASLPEASVSVTVDELESSMSSIENSRAQIIRVLKQLGKDGWGTFKTGRRGGASRFESPAGLNNAARQLRESAGVARESSKAGQGLNTVETSSINDVSLGQSNGESLNHKFMLRPNYSLEVKLPLDLTPAEANRLSDFIKSLPFS